MLVKIYIFRQSFELGLVSVMITSRSTRRGREDSMTPNAKISLGGLKDVPETLLYPLISRYVETKKRDGAIYDPKSVEILDALDYDVAGTKLFTISKLGICLRTSIIDEYVLAFLDAHPEGVVVNLGCGLDTRFHRVDNGAVRWFDLDLPETIDLRKHFFVETDRYRFVAKSALDLSWVDSIPRGQKTFFIMEGFSYYFHEKEVRTMLSTIREHFPGAELAMEAFDPFYIKMSGRMGSKDPLDKKATGLLKWGIANGRALEAWFEGVHFVEEQYVVAKKPEVFPLIYRILFAFLPFMTKMTKIIYLKFD